VRPGHRSSRRPRTLARRPAALRHQYLFLRVQHHPRCGPQEPARHGPALSVFRLSVQGRPRRRRGREQADSQPGRRELLARQLAVDLGRARPAESCRHCQAAVSQLSSANPVFESANRRYPTFNLGIPDQFRARNSRATSARSWPRARFRRSSSFACPTTIRPTLVRPTATPTAPRLWPTTTWPWAALWPSYRIWKNSAFFVTEDDADDIQM
jgi:hypothetical protein